MADDNKNAFDWGEEDKKNPPPAATAAPAKSFSWEDEPNAPKVSAQPATPPKQPSYLSKVWTELTTPIPGHYSEVPEGAGLTGISSAAGEVSEAAKNRAKQSELTQLHSASEGIVPSLGERAKHLGYNVLSSTAGSLEGLTSPRSQAIGLATLAAPEIMGPSLVAHGGVTALEHAPGAVHGNPAELEQSLGGLAEATGGAAGTAEAFKGGIKNTPFVKNTGPLRQTIAEKIVAPLTRKPPVATMADIKFGRNAPSAIANEGLVAGSREALLDKVNERVGELSKKVDEQLQNHPNALNRVDVEPVIDKVIDKGIQSAKKVANTAAVTRLENLRGALKTEYGPTSGTPFEMNNLKRQIGDAAADLHAFKAEDPVEGSAASALADIYTGVKEAVNKEIPEVQTINERIADLMGAKTGIARNIALHVNKSPFSVIGPGHAAAKAIEATVGSTPVRTGLARVLNIGNVEGIPNIETKAPTPSFNFPIGPQIPSHMAPIGPELPKSTMGQFPVMEGPSRSGLWNTQVGMPPALEWGTPPRVPPMAPIRGEQIPLGLAPENAPLFNIPVGNVPARFPGIPRLAGKMDVSNPQLEAQTGGFPRTGPLKGVFAGTEENVTRTPSEKAATMSAKAKDLGPEFTAQQWQEEINRNKAVLRNESATPEEKTIAAERLRDAEKGMKNVPPPAIAKALEGTGWRYLGRTEPHLGMGVTEIQAPNGRESITVLDKDLKADIIREKIKEKERQFSTTEE